VATKIRSKTRGPWRSSLSRQSIKWSQRGHYLDGIGQEHIDASGMRESDSASLMARTTDPVA